MDSPCIKQTVCKVLKIFQYGKYLVAYVLKDYWYHSWLASTRQFETLGSMPQGGAGGQNLEHLIFAFVESFVFNRSFFRLTFYDFRPSGFMT